jgi:hypothetical protein
MLPATTDNTRDVARPTRTVSRSSASSLTITKLSSKVSKPKVSRKVNVPDMSQTCPRHVSDMSRTLIILYSSIDEDQSSSSSTTMDTVKAASALITLVAVDNEHHRLAASYHPRSLPKECYL